VASMRICHVCSGFPPSRGGVETFVYNVAKRQADRGHRVVVVTSDRGKRGSREDIVEGIRVLRSPEYYYFFEVPVAPGIFSSLLKLDFDVLHVHGMTPIQTDVAVRIGKLRGRRVVLTYHFDAETEGTVGKILGAAYSSLARRTVRSAGIITTTSKSYTETSPVLRGFHGSISITQPAPALGPEKSSSADASWLDDSQKGRTLLFVGQLKYYKGIDVLLRAFKLATERHADARLVVVGDGPEMRDLVNLARALDILDRTFFTGFIEPSALARTYKSADIFVFPSVSRREALGIALLDAMAFGKAVIATNIPGPNTLVRDGKNGILVPPGRVEALADAILELLRDEAKRQMLGKEARNSVKDMNWDTVVSQFEKLYER